MADTKISVLTSAGALTGDEVVPIVQSGGNAKLALSDFIPANGSTGQVLRKTSIDPYAAAWSSVGLVPDGSVAGTVLTQLSGTPGDVGFETVRQLPDPSGAVEGDVLTIDGTGTPIYQAPAASGLTYRQVLSATSLT